MKTTDWLLIGGGVLIVGFVAYKVWDKAFWDWTKTPAAGEWQRNVLNPALAKAFPQAQSKFAKVTIA